MLRLFPAPPVAGDPEAIYDDLWPALPTPPAARPYVLLNMVSSVDGKVAVAGSASPLGSTLDHRLMRALRAACDGVMIGASTLRAERIDPRVGTQWTTRRVARGQTAEPLAIIVTRTGDLPLDRRYFTHPGVPRLIIGAAGITPGRRAALAAHADLIIAPTPDPDLAWVLRVLRTDYGVAHLLVEGGPTLNAGLIAANLVDELCWTLAPKIIGGETALTLVTGQQLPEPRRLALLSAYLHEEELFLRYRVNAG